MARTVVVLLLAWLAVSPAWAEALPFVDPASGLVLQPLRRSMVVSRLGPPVSTRRSRAADAAQAEWLLTYPALGLEFQAPASERDADDPLVQWMTVREPMDRATRRAAAAHGTGAEPASTAPPPPRWTLDLAGAPDGPGLHVGMDLEHFDTVVRPHFHVQQTSSPRADGSLSLLLNRRDGSTGSSLRVHFVDGRVSVLNFETGSATWLVPGHRRLVTTTAWVVLAGLLAGWLAERAVLRRRAADGRATVLPLGTGQRLLHGSAWALLAGAAACALIAWQMGQVQQGFEQKVSPLLGLASACTVLVCLGLLMRSRIGPVARLAQWLFVGAFAAILVAEGLFTLRAGVGP